MGTLLAGKRRLSPFLARCFTTSAPLSCRGIRGVVRGLNLKEEELEDMKPEHLEDMMQVSHSTFSQEATQIERETRIFQHHLRKKTIGHKYFKHKGPKEENFLTWSMKQQLKYLYSSDPGQWTPEALSKAFPISPEGVMRLLKTQWVPKSEAARQKHDQAVAARWKKHMKGQLGNLRILEKVLNDKFVPEKQPVPVMDVEHVMSTLEGLHFDGEQPFTPKILRPKNKLPKQPKMKGKSFQSIIRNYEIQTSEVNAREREMDASASGPAMISGPPQYEGTYSRITSTHFDGKSKRQRIYSEKKNQIMTHTEFMKKNRQLHLSKDE